MISSKNKYYNNSIKLIKFINVSDMEKSSIFEKKYKENMTEN